jgi:predicted metalloprotease with PDZ domain
MFKRYSAAIVILLSALASAGQVSNKQSYKFTIDLRNVNDDKIKVDLITPVITQKTIAYHLPKIVPGTYSEDDYGRYVEEFTALDKKGNKLNVVRADTNSWTISGADKLYRISYLVNDSYDDRSTKQVIFEPAGSNIQKDTNYILNNHCFLGYFDNMKNVSYEINIKHPANFYGSTALIDLDKSNVTDKFITGSYNSIVDNPFMYNVPDTTVIKVGKTEVLVSVYSPSKRISSKFLTSKLEPLLLAQTKYLGGKLPVEKYAFIIYLTGRRGVSGGIGALEHSFSSLYFLLDSEPDQLSTFVSDASAHEFFHIITPLSIHSEEIQNFDFNHPRMSRHLWLYEGSTEYHAQMVQEKYGLISPEELLKRLSGKITASKNSYNDTVPFTVMSKEVLGAYERQFGNVYQKGALINMCLDIKLLQHSNGKHGIMKMIRDLSNKYGNQKGFVDATLFNEIEKLTYPEIKQFLETYVGGSKPLPFEEIFNTVGIKYIPEVETKDSLFSSGAVTFRFNQTTGRLRVADVSKMNALGKKLGYQRSDEIVSINGDVISAANFNSYLRNFGKNSKEGDDLVIKVVRKDQNGADTTVELKATMTKFPVFKYNVLEFENDATPQQLLIRNAWLKPNDLQKN